MITEYDDVSHREQVMALWRDVFNYKTARNDPALSLSKKLEMKDGLLFVAVEEGAVTGTVMAGYDGHRGWLYSVAVAPKARGRGTGSALVRHAERALKDRGCVKINLQINAGNEGVVAFYRSLGYVVEERISMGKEL